jgi:GNAT superfamily N-acetyltransferase
MMSMKNMQNFSIERVNAVNFRHFLRLIFKLAEYESLDPPDGAAQKRLRRDALSKNPRYNAFLGKLGNEYVAYVIYFHTYSSFLAVPTFFLEDIFVLEEHRRKGIGRKMFEFCKVQARKAGCKRMEWIVLDWNTSAQEFYEKNGAKKLDWQFYRKILG